MTIWIWAAIYLVVGGVGAESCRLAARQTSVPFTAKSYALITLFWPMFFGSAFAYVGWEAFKKAWKERK